VSEFLQTLLNFIREFWPLAVVKHWQIGCWYRLGRFKGTRPPGPYWVIPFADEILPVNMPPAIIFTGRQDITLDDGSLLSWQAAATLRVVDPERATNGVDNYMETGREALSAVLADRLASVDAERLTPEKRGRLMGDLTRWVNEEIGPYGLEAEKVRFVTFVRNAKTLRLMQDQSAGLGEW
jgi:regulator of protease activity HflC (stomatin/prohibitin superfamily)